MIISKWEARRAEDQRRCSHYFEACTVYLLLCNPPLLYSVAGVGKRANVTGLTWRYRKFSLAWLDSTWLGLSFCWLDIFQNIKLWRGFFLGQPAIGANVLENATYDSKKFNCILESIVWYRVLSVSLTDLLSAKTPVNFSLRTEQTFQNVVIGDRFGVTF